MNADFIRRVSGSRHYPALSVTVIETLDLCSNSEQNETLLSVKPGPVDTGVFPTRSVPTLPPYFAYFPPHLRRSQATIN